MIVHAPAVRAKTKLADNEFQLFLHTGILSALVRLTASENKNNKASTRLLFYPSLETQILQATKVLTVTSSAMTMK